MRKLMMEVKSNNTQYHTDELRFKFLGSLKGIECDDKSSSILLNHNVIEEHYINNKKHYRYVEPFVDEFFTLIKYYVEIVLSDPNSETNNCFYEIEKFLRVNDKLDFLRNKFQQIFPEDVEMFAVYRGETKDPKVFANGLKNWKDYFLWCFLDPDPNLVKLYLNFSCDKKNGNYVIEQFSHFMNYVIEYKNEIDEDFFKFLNDWSVFYQKDVALNSILEKINELESPVSDITTSKQKVSINKPKVDYFSIKLNDLFQTKVDYSIFEAKLIKNDIIDSGFNVIHQEVGSKDELLCAMVYVLITGGHLADKKTKPEYYKKDKFMAKVAINAINNTFKDTITESNYTTHKKTFVIYPNDKRLKLFDFMSE